MDTDIVPAVPTPVRLPSLAVAGYLGSLHKGSQRSQAAALRSIALMLGQPDPHAVAWHEMPPAVLDSIRSRLAETYAPATANRYLSAIRGVLRQAWRNGLMTADAFSRLQDIRPVKGSRLTGGRDIPLTEQQALLRSCSEDAGASGSRDAAIIGLLLGCGLRRAEVAALGLEDVEAAECSIVVHGKGGKQRKVWLTNGTAQAMQDWLQVRGAGAGPLFAPIQKNGRIIVGKGITAQAIYMMLEVRSRESGIEAVRPHDCRRTFVGGALERGIDISTVAALVGHSSVTTTQRYDRRPDAVRRAAMQAVTIPYEGRTAVQRLVEAARELNASHARRLDRLRRTP